MMRRSHIYIGIVLAAYAMLVILFTTLPRSKYSELEKRDLATFPALSADSLASGAFTRDISRWFSDSEPYRDVFMTMSMEFSDWQKLKLFGTQNNITFHASTDDDATAVVPDVDNDAFSEYSNEITANSKSKIANHGIIIVGEGSNVRALMAYGGGAEGGKRYAAACNKYQEVFGPMGINVYCMVVPSAAEFYCPEAAKDCTKPQLPTIKSIHDKLNDSVKVVNVYNVLAKHAKEDIYLRTDHHWSPLGAYYAAQEFARVAKVPFYDLSHFDRKVVHRFVGTMYGYSRDISVKNAPEDFVYYVPRDVTYTTTYINYHRDKSYNIIGESKEYSGDFFFTFADGNGGAYCTFMGGDAKITHVHTSTTNGRRMLLIKDSYGNPLSAYLFRSFEDIHVIDYRYFTKNLMNYVKNNKITDIVLFSGISRAYSGGEDQIRFINQPENSYHNTKKTEEKKKKKR